MLINGKDYDLRFGLRFIQTAKEIYCPEGIEYAGLNIKFDVTYGVNLMALHLQSAVAPAIANCIICATAHLIEQPTLEDIDVYIEDEIGKGRSIKAQCDHFFELLKSAPMLRDGLEEYTKTLDGFVEAIAKTQKASDARKTATGKAGGRKSGKKSTQPAT